MDSSKLLAPIEKGKVLAIATVEYDDKKQQVNMIASQNVEKKADLSDCFSEGLKTFFAGLLGQVKKQVIISLISCILDRLHVK